MSLTQQFLEFEASHAGPFGGLAGGEECPRIKRQREFHPQRRLRFGRRNTKRLDYAIRDVQGHFHRRRLYSTRLRLFKRGIPSQLP